MKRWLATIATLLLCGSIGAAVWLRANRFEIAASSDFRKFAESNSSKLYTYYPQLIDRIAADPDVAARVESVHLSVGDFDDPMYNGRDFSSLKDLPNLHTLDVMYARNTDHFMPIVNSISTLRSAMFAYCTPRDSWVESLNSSSLRKLQIHDYRAEAVSNQAVERLSLRMPNCEVEVTGDD